MLSTYKSSFRVLLLGALFLALATVALGQSTATLQGTVKDQKGSVVPGVTARNNTGIGALKTEQWPRPSAVFRRG